MIINDYIPKMTQMSLIYLREPLINNMYDSSTIKLPLYSTKVIIPNHTQSYQKCVTFYESA